MRKGRLMSSSSKDSKWFPEPLIWGQSIAGVSLILAGAVGSFTDNPSSYVLLIMGAALLGNRNMERSVNRLDK